MFSSYFESNYPYYYLYSIRGINSTSVVPYFVINTSEHQIYCTAPEVYVYLQQHQLLNDFKKTYNTHSRHQLEDYKKQKNKNVFFARSSPIILNKFSYLHIQSKPNDFFISTKPFHYEDSPKQKIELNGIFEEPNLYEHFSILGLYVEFFGSEFFSLHLKNTTPIIKFLDVVAPIYSDYKESILFFLNFHVTHYNIIKEIRSLSLEQLYSTNLNPNISLILKDFLKSN
jgi:hypothetical protein